jgi:hypothetical protein
VKNRVAFLLGLDTAMLLLVVVLECINFTGLEWHQWLGFALCPVVLFHVVLQWPWFITQFRRMFTPGAYRVRVNAGLNLLLLALMAAVLFSGGFVSAQAVESLGESFGQVPIWSEVHGGLNFALVVLVGLHLALNWDWMVGACARPLFAHGRPGLGTAAVREASATGCSVEPAARSVSAAGRTLHAVGEIRRVSFAGWLGRAVAVLLVSSLAAGAAYFVIATTLPPGKRAAMERQRAAARADGTLRRQLAPRNRPAQPQRAGQLAGTFLITVLVAGVGRYVFRLRL